MAVVPAWRLRELLYSEPLVMGRLQGEVYLRLQQRTAAVSDIDDGQPKPGPETERPQIDADWDTAVKRALDAGEPPKDES